MSDRADKTYLARLAEQAERYDEMLQLMKEVVNVSDELSYEERNLLSVAYKNVVGTRRASWRIVSSIEQKESANRLAESASEDNDKEGSSSKNTLELITNYRFKIEKELEEVCLDIIKLLEHKLIESAKSVEATVFFCKMKGDYYRYMAEFAKDEKREEYAGKALDGYSNAMTIAQDGLKAAHPIRLGLALNYSVFHCEIQNSKDEACKLAKNAFDDAISGLDSLSEESYRDSTLILHLLRDNLNLWTSDVEGDEENAAQPSAAEASKQQEAPTEPIPA